MHLGLCFAVCISALAPGKLKSILDSYCGVCIVCLYFLYLSLVRGALSVFDCSKNEDGAWILDADPSIKCNVVRSMRPSGGTVGGTEGTLAWILSPHGCLSLLALFTPPTPPPHGPISPLPQTSCPHPAPSSKPGGIQESMKPVATLSLVLYTLGLPLTFLVILVRHRSAIVQDQTLREKNQVHKHT